MFTANCMAAKNSEKRANGEPCRRRHRPLLNGDSSAAVCPGGSYIRARW